ncbi:MAG: aminotransferase class I/II-fold pyridoxal phosphate-dependent enzyme [Bacteroidaceae bacterium]|nr:aminotransferase class I/II-fold pyridoxal phosphate-dependent enzyme [Bacteroidaceae bacterium]
MSKILLSLAHMGGAEQRFIHDAFDTNWVVPLGPNVDGFEQDLEHWLAPHAAQPEVHVVALSAGTAAIHLALVMLGIGPGDEVICQSFTFSASANPICYLGATPVFVDSEEGSWNMDPSLLKTAIEDRIQKTGKKPKAIIPVYLYGNPARIDEIVQIAASYDIPIVEDSAEAMGSMYDGNYCGTFGKYGILSFNGNKMITTSGGGALICHSQEEADRIKFFATQAREKFPYYQHEQIGYNYRLSNICAGIGRGQMMVLEDHIAHHQHIHYLYIEQLAGVKGITVHQPVVGKEIQPNYWLSTILVNPEEYGHTYQELSAHLAAHDVETRPLWKPMHRQPVFASYPSYVNGVSDRMFAQGLCLPSGPMVSEEDLKRVVTLIQDFQQ